MYLPSIPPPAVTCPTIQHSRPSSWFWGPLLLSMPLVSCCCYVREEGAVHTPCKWQRSLPEGVRSWAAVWFHWKAQMAVFDQNFYTEPLSVFYLTFPSHVSWGLNRLFATCCSLFMLSRKSKYTDTLRQVMKTVFVCLFVLWLNISWAVLANSQWKSS